MTAVSYQVSNGIAVLTLSNPPVNGLSHGLRKGILESLSKANADDQVRAVVIIGEGSGFSGGADIREFGTPKMIAAPTLTEVVEAVEENDKPVIAAVHGNCMGGGFELALACHYRVAAMDANLSLPEVKLGLLPGAGGTQRLPRAVGLEVATNMIVSGEPVPAPMLAHLGAFNQVAPTADLLKTALALAEKVAGDRPLPRLSERKVQHPNPEGFYGFMRTSLRQMAPNFPAPHKCLEAVRATLDKPFKEGLEVERRLFSELLLTPESASLRHFFFAEREAARIEGLTDDIQPKPIEKVGIIGAGTMGAGIAINFLNASIPVTLLEINPEALERGVNSIRSTYQAQVDKKKLKADKLEARMSRLSGTSDYADLADCDLIIEAVFEEMSVKEKVFRELDRVAKPDAILASNTSNLDVNIIASFTNRPGQVIGLHFFSPANVMKLLEVVRGDRTSLQTLATSMQLAKRIRKVAVVAGVCDGFIGNRMVGPYALAAGYLLEEGASPQQIDQALEKFGFAMGPFRMSDLAGNDIGWAVRKRVVQEQPDLKYPKIVDRICEAGRFGQKTGAGWYRYEGRHAVVDPEVEAMIDEYRKEVGVQVREVSDEEIVTRCVLALVNEGAKILEEGIAARASDIDIVYIYGYGFPVFRGGPMHYASKMGLATVERTLRRLSREAYGDRSRWEPARLISTLAAEGNTFSPTGLI